MISKKLIRKRYLYKREKKYFSVNSSFFDPLIKFLKNNKNTNLGIYYPTSYELDILNIFKISFFKRFKIYLPIIDKRSSMNFYKWKEKDVLYVNKFGILEPFKSRPIIPGVILVPLLAFDKNKHRLGYGKGFYDKFLNKHSKKNKKITTIGVAFSFQKHHKLPIYNKDYKLDYILTEKGII